MRRSWAIAAAGYAFILLISGHASARGDSLWIGALAIFMSQFGLGLGYLMGSLNSIPRSRFLMEMRNLIESSSRAILSYLDRFSEQGSRLEQGIQIINDRLQAQELNQFAASARMQELAEHLQGAIDPNKGVVEEVLLLMSQANFSISKAATEDGVCPCCGERSPELRDEELFHLPKYHQRNCAIPAAIRLCAHIEVVACSNSK